MQQPSKTTKGLRALFHVHLENKCSLNAKIFSWQFKIVFAVGLAVLSSFSLPASAQIGLFAPSDEKADGFYSTNDASLLESSLQGKQKNIKTSNSIVPFEKTTDTNKKVLGNSVDFLETERELLSELRAAIEKSTTDSDIDKNNRIKNALMGMVQAYAYADYNEELLGFLKNYQNEVSKIEDEDFRKSISDLRIHALYRMRRFSDVLDEVSTEQEAGASPLVMAIRAIAYTHLGQYDRADHLFQNHDLKINDVQNLYYLYGDYILKKAETFYMLERYSSAEKELGGLDAVSLTPDQNNQLEYMVLVNALDKDFRENRIDIDAYRSKISVLERASAPFSSYAKLRILRAEIKNGFIDVSVGLERVENLALGHKGGMFDIEIAQLRAELLEKQGRAGEAISNYRFLMNEAPQTHYSIYGQDKARRVLASLFSDTYKLPILEATQIFYENLDLLSPGDEGDAQIRSVSKQLVQLDLLDQAAELLEHQVFQRLRGVDRAIFAVDLAQIYLQDKNPDEALRVIRSSRITGLDDGVRSRRRHIEVTALWKSGQHDKALARLELTGAQTLSLETKLLKASIEQDMGDLIAASATFHQPILDMLIEKEQLTHNDEINLLQAASTYARVGDDAKIKEVYEVMKKHHSDSTSLPLIHSLIGENEPEAFLSAYRSWENPS